MHQSTYRVLHPQTCRTGVVVASPHSGRTYAPAFLRASVLDDHAIRSSEDAYIDLLLEDVPAMGAPLLLSDAPRAWLDLNRSADELDPGVITGIPRGALNPRVSSGLGVIPRVVANGRAIYRGKITRAEAEARIRTAWRPYHAALQTRLDAARTTFGTAILIDVHSMPHEAATVSGNTPPPEIVLGDRFGASASDMLVQGVEHAFREAGFRVARNAPFAGAYIAQHYGRPARNQHAIQIEIDRSLYMDERRITLRDDFPEFRRRFIGAMEQVLDLGAPPMQLAAE